jgi:phosphoglycolate phosphatase-like HAD superfamily hydrolase
MLAAVRQVYGVTFEPGEEPIRKVVPNGKTDPQIVREMLLPRGVGNAAIDAGMDECSQLACDLHARSGEPTLTPSDSERVRAVLTDLRDDGHILALLTGNLERIGRHKIALAGLGDLFPPGLGGFGSDAEHRPELVPLARARAGIGGSPHPAHDTLVIGDTPLDVAAAIAGGVRSIGVTGTHHSRAALLESGADAVVDELDEIPALVSTWPAL